MKANFRWTVLLLGLLLAGCAGMNTSPRMDEGSRFWRGTLVQDGDGYWFELCGQVERHPVIHLGEPLEEEYARQRLGDGWPVYVEAFGQMLPEGLDLRHPVLIGGTLTVCDYNLPGVRLRGVSSRDNAIFDLRDRYIRVSFGDSLRQLGFRRPEVERLGNTRRWRQEMTAGGKRQLHKLLLEVETRACKGPHGAWYALSMSAELDGRYYRGCARLGDLEHWRLFAGYQTSETLTTRRLGLQLEPDGKALLLEDYLNQQPVIEHSGSWRLTGTDRLEVRLEGDLPAGSERLVFGLALDGRLKLTHFHPAYGRGLELLPSGAPMVQQDELDWWQ